MTDWWSFGQGAVVGVLGAAGSFWGVMHTRSRDRKTDQDQDRSALTEASMIHLKRAGSARGTYLVEIVNGSPRPVQWAELVDFSRPEAEPSESWATNPFTRGQSVSCQHLPSGDSLQVSVVLKEADDTLIEQRYPDVTCTFRWLDASGQWWQRTGTCDPVRIDKPST